MISISRMSAVALEQLHARAHGILTRDGIGRQSNLDAGERAGREILFRKTVSRGEWSARSRQGGSWVALDPCSHYSLRG